MTETTNLELKKNNLTPAEAQEVEVVFAEAKDFRTVWERITSPIDSIIWKRPNYGCFKWTC